MEMTVEQLLWEIYTIYPYTDKRIEIEKSNKSEIDFWQYLVNLDDKFYELINEMIICLEKEDIMIQTRIEISEQLIGMSDFHFNEFPKYIEDPNVFSSYRLFAVGSAHSNGKLGRYIKYADFSKERIDSTINELKKLNLILIDSIENDNTKGKKSLSQILYVEVAAKWASMELDNAFTKTNKGSKVARELFKDKSLNEIKNITGIINATVRKVTAEKPQSNPHKDLRERIKDDDFFDDVIYYCKQNNIPIIHPVFKQREKDLFLNKNY